jgi:uncharacterized protein (TIGR02588 family)
MNNNSEDISKKSIAQIIKELKPGQLKVSIGVLIAIIVVAFWAGYIYKDIVSSKNNISTGKPKFHHIFKPSIKEQETNLFKIDFILENRGNATATSIHGEIKSNIELKEVDPQWQEIKLPFLLVDYRKII